MPNPHGLPAREVLRRFLNFAQASAPDKTVFLELGSRPEFLHRDLEVFTATFDTLEADHTGWITIDSVAAYVAPVCDPEEAPPGKRRTAIRRLCASTNSQASCSWRRRACHRPR